MMTGHKLLIGTGAVVIAGMLLIAAFALGGYVREHGWTRDGLVLQGPGGGGPGGPGMPGPPLPLPGDGRRPDEVGRIKDIFEDTLILATPNGPRAIELNEQTRVETPAGDTSTLDDLERGQRVSVFGHRNHGGQALVAELLVLLPAPEPPPGDAPSPPKRTRP
jgi:hypothetical protein